MAMSMTDFFRLDLPGSYDILIVFVLVFVLMMLVMLV